VRLLVRLISPPLTSALRVDASVTPYTHTVYTVAAEKRVDAAAATAGSVRWRKEETASGGGARLWRRCGVPGAECTRLIGWRLCRGVADPARGRVVVRGIGEGRRKSHSSLSPRRRPTRL